MRKLLIFILFLIALGSTQQIGAKYLVITNDAFYDAILPYVQWKHKMGYKTKIVRVPSEIGQNATAIRDYIVYAYNNWQIRPEFILFVGAPNYIPWSLSTSPYGDNNYTNMDGDIYNEILSGRLNVHSVSEAQTVVAKMLRYERYPDISDPLWFKKGCTIVNDRPNGQYDDDSITYRLDAEYVASHMVNNGYVKVDTFFASRGANATSVVNTTNEGRNFVLYRGSATNNWYSPFAVNPDALNNSNKLPIVISATCGTLGTGSTPTTAERWFLTGSPTTLRGAAGYFATTTSITNGAYLRSAVTRGFFDGVFLYKRRTFGEACEDGRIRVYNTYGATNEYRGFTTIGDPAMTIWTATPRLLTVSYDSILHAGTEETLQVNVQYQGVSIESAYVCIVFDTLIYQTAWTNSSGYVTFVCSPADTGTMYLTVTGRNLYPFEGIVSIIHNSVHLTYTGNSLTDSLGNNNGNLDPGETILLWAQIKNIGATTAQGVRAVLRTTDTMIAIAESISFYGDIEPHQISQGLNPFVFTVSPKNYQHFIPFELTMYDTNDSAWSANFTLMTTGTMPGGNGTGPDP
ncbi:MAG: C25 family cysteine peptidase, partial [candidate division WOR-3 bacterium]